MILEKSIELVLLVIPVGVRESHFRLGYVGEIDVVHRLVKSGTAVIDGAVQDQRLRVVLVVAVCIGNLYSAIGIRRIRGPR